MAFFGLEEIIVSHNEPESFVSKIR